MNVSERMAAIIREAGVRHVFGVVGGGAMYLNDAFRDLFVPMHHEQAAAFAADAYARLNGLGCCLVTTGPGGTNALTGLAASRVDSIPVVFISGQVTTGSLLSHHAPDLTQLGVQEIAIAKIAKRLAKDAILCTKPHHATDGLRELIQKALRHRKGPVWMDIPLDVQSAPAA